jgi:hypothetical protein
MSVGSKSEKLNARIYVFRFPLRADIAQRSRHVCLVPTDSCIATNSRKFIGANLISSATGRRWFEIGCQACSSSSNALASFRSSVSKPSVNRP